MDERTKSSIWSGYTGSLKWLPERTILLTKHGSQAYGTALPTSDLDVKGVAVPPREYFHGFVQRFEQAEQRAPDLVVYDVRKFFNLAADCNPNIIEVMWTDPGDWLQVTEHGLRLVDARRLFLSRKAKHTFSGYAAAQLKRIRTHRRWLVNPPAAPPVRADFGLPESSVISADDRAAAEAAVQKKIDEWGLDLEPLARPTRIELEGKIASALAEMQIGADEQWCSASRVLGFSENFIEAMKCERRYRTAQREWTQFQDWKKTRNVARGELEAKFGYDCYADDTEFLTRRGWRLYDEVTADDELATVFARRDATIEKMEHRHWLGVEYQRAIDRFEGRHTGPMYHLTGQHTDTLVTPNHRMLFRTVERRSGAESDFRLEEASWLPDSFDVLIAPNPRQKRYTNGDLFAGLPVPDRAYLTLMGWYLSDGCGVFTDKKRQRPKSLRISQKLGGKLSWSMARWHGDHGERANSSLHEYRREPNSYSPESITERVLDVRHPGIAKRMLVECGARETKRVPRWVFGLSQYLMEHLLRALIGGDGTKREHTTKSDSYVYYSKLKLLADDVQELGLMCGWETARWGPFENTDEDGRTCLMYQVHLRPLAEGERTRRFVHSQNVERVPVKNQRIVCFTVPNGTLITRRNGKVGIHGNSKHGMHLVRLMRMCREILTTGEVVVKRPDAEELLAIRNGAWSYERLVEWAEREDAELEEVARTSPLPHAPDRARLDQLCQEIVETII